MPEDCGHSLPLVSVEEIVDVFMTVLDECKILSRCKKGAAKNIDNFISKCMRFEFSQTSLLYAVYSFFCLCFIIDDSAYKRAKQNLMNIADFEAKATIGKGSFATVWKTGL